MNNNLELAMKKISSMYNEGEIKYNIYKALSSILESNKYLDKNDTEKYLEYLNESKNYLEAEIVSIKIDKLNHEIDKTENEIKKEAETLNKRMNIILGSYGINLPDNIKVSKNDIDQDVEDKHFEDRIKTLLTENYEIKEIIYKIIDDYFKQDLDTHMF